MSPERLAVMLESNKKVKVRFAPSPTGALHAGSIRTALYNHFEARANNGTFLLRIEDTDQVREVPGAIEVIKESLLWLGAEWDEYAVQSERLDEYKKYADELVEKGHARVEENGAVLFVIPENRTVGWQDAIGNRDPVKFETNDLRRDAKGNSKEGFIILKADGYPTYHLANVIDDHLMDITHVIRGDEWFSSTPLHLLIYDAFDWTPPVFAHVPNVNGPDGLKLSKRRGAKNVLDYKAEGYLPEALLNYLMLLGWSPGDDREILTREEIIKEFSLDRVKASPAIFDPKKLEFMNQQYLMKLSRDQLVERLYNFDPTLREFDNELLSRLADPAQTRMKLLSDFRKLSTPFFSEGPVTESSEVKETIRMNLEGVENWKNDDIWIAIKKVMEEKSVGLKDIYQAIIGEKQGLPLSATFEILGREKTLALLK